METINTSVVPPREEVDFEELKEFEVDVVVIGGGPNGLITALYLQRSGLKVCVVEKRHEIGGGLATEEILFPGHLTNTHAVYHFMVDYMPVLKDFSFEISWIKPNYQVSLGDITLCRMIEDSKDSIWRKSLKEAERFEEFIRKMRDIVDEILAPATYYPPLPPVEFLEKMEKTRTGRELIRISEKSVVEVIDEFFEDEELKALLIYITSVWGIDPEETGMGFMVPLLAYRSTQKALCYGGSHRFASFMGREIVRLGGMILDNEEVVKVILEGKRAVGVETKEGRKIFAKKAIISSLNPYTTFLSLIGEENLPEDFKTLKNWKWDKWSFFTVHMVLDEAPEEFSSFQNILGLENSKDVLEFFRGVIDGKITKVAGHFTNQSLWDKTLSKDFVCFFQMCVPYDVNKDKIGEDIMNFLKDMKIKPKMYVFESPKDIENRLGMIRGSIKHGDYTPLQMGYFRPNEYSSAGRTPIKNFYICGAGMYPGGMIIGGPGYICANSVAEDLGIKKWWDYPINLKKFLKIYCE